MNVKVKRSNGRFSETVKLEGHIIDSLVLTKVLDRINEAGGRFVIDEIQVGQKERDPSRARLKVSASTQAQLDGLLKTLRNLGVEAVGRENVRLAPAPRDGVFPEDFYATTNLETHICLDNRWIKLSRSEMDCGIRVNPARRQAEPVRFESIRKGDLFVVAHAGIKVTPLEKPREHTVFEFMTSEASTEKPKVSLIHVIAREIRALRRRPSGKILVVAGPAVVHTGAREDLAWLIRKGYVDEFFSGNALAVHDIEADLFGTSLGLSLKSGKTMHGGHEHHLRAINRVRAVGSIRAAVKRGIIRGGIMHSVIKKGIPFVLAGSIRDDGPLPETIRDCIEAQKAMRELLPGVELALLLATTLHSVATGNILPGHVKTICVDMNPSSVTKLNDRGTLQSVGFVTDVGYFLRELRRALG